MYHESDAAMRKIGRDCIEKRIKGAGGSQFLTQISRGFYNQRLLAGLIHLWHAPIGKLTAFTHTPAPGWVGGVSMLPLFFMHS